MPPDQANKIARFLEGQGYKEQALEVATDPEHRFDLALALNQLDIALTLARDADADHKWKTVGDAALSAWDLALAEECFTNAHDIGSLLLLHSSTGSAQGLRALASQADSTGAHNVAFSCLWQLADIDGCIALLLKTGRTAEAVLFAQTYAPSRAARVAGKWRKELEGKGRGKIARILAMPPGVGGEAEGVQADEELFPEWEDWLKLEEEGKGMQESLIDIDGAEAGANGDVNGGANGVEDTTSPEAVEASQGLHEIEKEVEAEAVS